MTRWPSFALFLVTGYLTMTRSFAYIGLPPAKLFIGEVAMAWLLISRPSVVFSRWFAGVSQSSAFSAFSIVLACFLGFGWLELIRGLDHGYPPVLALQGFAFHYYPLWFFVGLWVANIDWTLLWRTTRMVAWCNGIYGILYIAFLNRMQIAFPGTFDVPIFGQPAGSAICVLGLLCLEKRLSRIWHLLLVNIIVMLGLQVRAEYLGFILGAVVWAVLTRRVDRLLIGGIIVAALLTVAFVADFSAPAPATRGGHISTREIAGRVIAPFNPELAAEWDPYARSQAGTAEWRIRWWKSIWEEIHQNTGTALFGEGYGYPLAKLVGYTERDIRTPHSIFFYALSYGGWIGVTLFFALQLTLGWTLWLAWRASRIPFAPVIWVTFLVGAFFGNAFETPFGAIPFYLLTGMAAAPLCAASRVRSNRGVMTLCES